MGFLPSEFWKATGKIRLKFENKVNGGVRRLGCLSLRLMMSDYCFFFSAMERNLFLLLLGSLRGLVMGCSCPIITVWSWVCGLTVWEWTVCSMVATTFSVCIWCGLLWCRGGCLLSINQDLQGCGNYGEADHGFNNCPLRRFVPPKFQIKFRKQVGETSNAIVNDPSWVQVQGKMNKKKATKMKKLETNTKEEVFGGIAVVYLSDGSSFESKESSNTSSKLSKCSSANTEENKEENDYPSDLDDNQIEKVCKDVMSRSSSERKEEINESNGDQNNPDDNQIENPNKKVIEQVVGCDGSTVQTDYTTEAIEDESKFIPSIQEEFYYDGDDEGGNFEMDYLMDEVPFLEGHIDEAGIVYPLPDFSLEGEVPFFPMNTENLILNQASIMESMLHVPSSSGSSKRKLVGVEGDTAFSGAGNKKPKN